MDKKVTVQSMYGEAQGIEVDVNALVGTDSFASFDLHLEDGTILRIKPSILQVVRLDNKWDVDGNPCYNVRSQLAVFVAKAPDELRRSNK